MLCAWSLFGIHLELELLPAVAPDDHVRDARHRHQPPPHRPVGDHREVGQVAVVAREADLHRPARGRERLERPRDARRGRQARDRRCDALVHELAGLERIGAAVEDQRDRRQARDRGRAHRLEPGRRVERLLHRDRDEGLDLLGRHPQALGLHLDERRRELREDVDRHVADPRRAERRPSPPPARRR